MDIRKVKLIKAYLRSLSPPPGTRSPGNPIEPTEGNSLPEYIRLSPHSPLKEATADGPVVMSIINNEMPRLPYFLSYYRQLGASCFVIVDNESTDGSAGYLQSQPDVLLFNAPLTKYKEGGSSKQWLNLLAEKTVSNRWILFADADEILCWPDCQNEGLEGLTTRASESGWNRVFTPLIDAYGDKPLCELEYVAGAPFEETCPWVDPADSLSATFLMNRLFLWGGPRGLGQVEGEDYLPALLSKQSLVYFHESGPKIDASNFTRPPYETPSSVIAPLCHFKLMPGLANRAKKRLSEAQDWQGGIQWQRFLVENYEEKMLKHPDSVLIDGGRGLADHIDRITNIILENEAQ